MEGCHHVRKIGSRRIKIELLDRPLNLKYSLNILYFCTCVVQVSLEKQHTCTELRHGKKTELPAIAQLANDD